MKTITISNRKGGTGKTSLALAIASILGKQGYHVLLIDTDSQVNATTTVEATFESKYTVFDLLVEDCTAGDSISETKYYDLIRGDRRLVNLEQVECDGTELKMALGPIQKNYDFCIIDSPPSLGNIQRNSIIAADSILIPILADYYSLDAIDEILKTIKVNNKNASIDGIIFSQYDRTQDEDVFNDVSGTASEMGIPVYKIRHGKLVKRSQKEGKPIADYGRNYGTKQDYDSLVKSLLERWR